MDVAQLIRSRSPQEIVTCEASVRVRDAVALLAKRRIGAVPVTCKGEVIGMFSERDVLYRLAEEGAPCLERELTEVMTAPAITVEPRTKVDEALALMTRRRIRHLPVFENGAMCGFISIGDLVKSRIDEIEREAESMRAYIQTA